VDSNFISFDVSGNGKSSSMKKSADYFLQTNGYSQTQDNHGCFSCISGGLPYASS